MKGLDIVFDGVVYKTPEEIKQDVLRFLGVYSEAKLREKYPEGLPFPRKGKAVKDDPK